MQASALHKTLRERPIASIASTRSSREKKLQQCAKIAELRQALLEAGLKSVKTQAVALGLSRSTTWIILQAEHKSSGLTGAIVRRMLSSTQLPASARQVIEQYVELKLTGAYGHDAKQIERFRRGVGGS